MSVQIQQRREELLELLRQEVIEIRDRLAEITGHVLEDGALDGDGQVEATAALTQSLRREFSPAVVDPPTDFDPPSARDILDLKLTALIRDRDRLEMALIVLHGRHEDDAIHAVDDVLAEMDSEIVKTVVDRERAT